ncbi:oxidoreductase [[Phormidium ambiguum] IAM M-71]|uniref:Oxidoreductase n=1 Tax=[Phormidium ambiguum] IAM M-71 TaxID=454136 RepID=A0A1U7IQA4_9CYAN|nr:Gfo/Idh/MocA family oxidoreductase [Phormidium ambiguum]OKH39604.1 oxidoreductase [Phormidium ambiguum IAM M-71]
MTINIAILGAGRWGVHLVRNFLALPQVRLTAVVDPNIDRLEDLQRRHQFDDTVVLATQWSEVRQLPELNAVVIATPASTHYELVADALNLGYHVLAEKPLTLNPQESVELCHLAEQQQRQLVVDQTYLFHPAVAEGKKVMEQGVLGDLRYGYATRTNLGPVRQDVDAMWDLAIHDIAIFNNWLSETPSQVQANGKLWLQTTESTENPLYDLVWLTLNYPSGFQAFIHVSWSNPDKQRRLGVVGSQGTLIFDELSVESPLSIHKGNFAVIGNKFNPENLQFEVVNVPKIEPLKQVCEHFVTCVERNQPSFVSSSWVGTKLVEILYALTQSLQQGGQPIKLN